MKKKLLVALFALFILTSKSYGQFSFGVSPGIGLNSAYFGYKLNSKIVPFIGFQYLKANIQLEESGQRQDWDQNKIISYSDINQLSGSLYIPNIGVKYFIKQKNKIQAYLSLSLSKPLASGRLKNDAEENSNLKDEIKKFSMFGGELGFGMEYFFDENFSVGGEFGLRYLPLKYKDSYERDVFDPNSGNTFTTEFKDEYKFNMNPTYTKISLNYYF